MGMYGEPKLTLDSQTEDSFIPIRTRKVGCRCLSGICPTPSGSTSFCESCLSVQAALDSYLNTCSDSECDELVEAIWNLQCVRNTRNTILMFPQQPPDDVIVTISKLQGRLTALNTSLDRIKQGNQVYLLLAVIARQTDIMIKSKKVQWWMS